MRDWVVNFTFSGYKNRLFNLFFFEKKILRFLLAIAVTFVCACSHNTQITSVAKSTGTYANFPEGGGLFVSVTFGADGRLWRVVPEKQYIYVDYSDDLGKSFSPAVRINSEAQKIKVSGENRPAIVVDGLGHIYVIYAAEHNQPMTLFYSVSSDQGHHFSSPKPISDKADEANTFQGRMALDQRGKVNVFWHDERNRTDWRQVGNAIYSSIIDASGRVSPAHKLSDALCDCCRIAVGFGKQNQSIIFTRFVYPGNIRDHGLVKTDETANSSQSWRATFDNWTIEACPEHGPAISISEEGHYHIVWFTQGSKRQGLFYAHSNDAGQHFSTPLPIGEASKLPSHPDVMAEGRHIILAWTEYDGHQTSLLVQQSKDDGETWFPPEKMASFVSDADYPFLLKNKVGAFVSWNSKTEGYKLIPLNGIN